MSDLSQGFALAREFAAFTADTRLYDLELPSSNASLLVEHWVGKEDLRRRIWRLFSRHYVR